MPIPDNRSKYKRTNLFLLRVWCDDEDENQDEQENEQGDKGEEPCRMWHGMVQRTVSGEAHSFGAKDGLIEVLEAMIYKDRKERLQHTRPGPQGKTSYEAAVLPGGDDQTERTGVDEEIR
ncbi:MAG: hypothetical protein M3328_15190 [Chloroflexota bacterium]|nr:hypothetical protein [Chloroflexota bacterium]